MHPLRRKISLAALVFVLAVAAAVFIPRFFRPPEPSYEGKTASQWIAELRFGRWPEQTPSERALAEMGPTAVPFLCKAMFDGKIFVSRSYTLVHEVMPGAIQIRLPDPAAYGSRMGSAAQALGDLGPLADNAVPCLLDAVSHLGGAAAQSLVSVRPNPKYLPALTNALFRAEPSTRRALIAAIETMGPYAQPVLPMLTALARSDTNQEVRVQCVRTLARLGPDQAALDWLIEMLKDPDRQTRASAAYAFQFAATTDPRAVEALAEAVQDKDASVCEGAVTSLGRLRAAARPAVPMLRKRFNITVGHFQFNAARALVRIDTNELTAVWPALVEALEDRPAMEPRQSFGASLASQAVELLAELGPVAGTAAPRLCEMLLDPDPLFRVRAAEALWKITGPANRWRTSLAAGLRDPDCVVRGGAARALWELDGEVDAVLSALRQILVECRNTPGPTVAMQRAARTLGKMGTKARPAVPELVQALRQTDRYGRITIASAMSQIDFQAAAAYGITHVIREVPERSRL